MKDQKYIDLLIERFKLRDTKVGAMSELRDKSFEIEMKIKGYVSSHPGVDNKENTDEAYIQYMGDNICEYYMNLQPFDGDPDKIPDLPNLPIDFLRSKVWPYLIKAGAIPKKDLIVGKKYLGSCRNSSWATWDGKEFIYTRTKFGQSWEETINHFQDDDGSDVFIPIYEKENSTRP